MKILVKILFVFTFSIQTSFSNNHSDNAEHALELLDNICGDTWCEGDFNFEFTDLEINKKDKSAVVNFEMIDEWYDTEKRFSTFCVVPNISSFKDVIDFNSNKKYLTDYFYETLGECISEREDYFRKILDTL